MTWTIACCLFLGAVCALRVPILVFALAVLAIIIAVFAVVYLNGASAWSGAWEAVVVGVSLEAGYVIGYVALYFYFARQHLPREESSSEAVPSERAQD